MRERERERERERTLSQSTFDTFKSYFGLDLLVAFPFMRK